MVLDKYQGQITPRYLIYDIVTLNGQPVGKEDFYPHLLNYIKKELIGML